MVYGGVCAFESVRDEKSKARVKNISDTRLDVFTELVEQESEARFVSGCVFYHHQTDSKDLGKKRRV